MADPLQDLAQAGLLSSISDLLALLNQQSAISNQQLFLLWFLPFLTFFRLAKRKPNLDDISPVDGPLVSVIVPARNESETIETVVGSVLATRYPHLELLVVDDRSTDDTAARVARIAAHDSRLRLIHGEELPDGWYGKPWACVQGYRAARGEILLFTDADTKHDPELLGRAVAARAASRADLL